MADGLILFEKASFDLKIKQYNTCKHRDNIVSHCLSTFAKENNRSGRFNNSMSPSSSSCFPNELVQKHWFNPVNDSMTHS